MRELLLKLWYMPAWELCLLAGCLLVPFLCWFAYVWLSTQRTRRARFDEKVKDFNSLRDEVRGRQAAVRKSMRG